MNIEEIDIETTMPKLNVIEKSDSGLSSQKSVNFGPGADLLMNQNKVNQSPKNSNNISLDNLSEIDNLDLDNKSLLTTVRHDNRNNPNIYHNALWGSTFRLS